VLHFDFTGKVAAVTGTSGIGLDAAGFVTGGDMLIDGGLTAQLGV
jgi:hypothetical protein